MYLISESETLWAKEAMHRMTLRGAYEEMQVSFHWALNDLDIPKRMTHSTSRQEGMASGETEAPGEAPAKAPARAEAGHKTNATPPNG